MSSSSTDAHEECYNGRDEHDKKDGKRRRKNGASTRRASTLRRTPASATSSAGKRKQRFKPSTGIGSPLHSSTGFLTPHQPYPYFGDDLLRAERFEAKLAEDKKWSAKLEEIRHDDQRDAAYVAPGASNDDSAWEEEMSCMRGESIAKQATQVRFNQNLFGDTSIDSAEGSRKNGCHIEKLRYLNENEYAEYIRDGMHRRKDAASIAFDKERHKKWSMEQARREEAKVHGNALREEKRREREREAEKRSVEAARSKWDAAWSESSNRRGDAWTIATIPWPIVQDCNVAGLVTSLPLDKAAIQFFLFAHDSTSESVLRLRSALLRFHPDRFFSSQRFARIQNQSDRESIRRHVHIVSQVLSEIVDDRRA